MKLVKEYFGRVAITVDKDNWDINKDYDRLVLITNEEENGLSTYISRKPVQAGTDIHDEVYWKKIGLNTNSPTENYSITIFNISKYFQNVQHSDNLVPFTISTAIEQSNAIIKQPYRIITFIKTNGDWEIWQFKKSNYIDDWNDTTNWECIYCTGLTNSIQQRLTNAEGRIGELRYDYDNIIPITTQQIDNILNN